MLINRIKTVVLDIRNNMAATHVIPMEKEDEIWEMAQTQPYLFGFPLVIEMIQKPLADLI